MKFILKLNRFSFWVAYGGNFSIDILISFDSNIGIRTYICKSLKFCQGKIVYEGKQNTVNNCYGCLRAVGWQS